MASLRIVESTLAQAFLLVSVLSVLVGALTRAFGHPQNWTLDLAVFAFAWSVFLSADVAWARNKLVAMDFLVQRFPRKFRQGVQLLNLVLIALFFSFVAYHAVLVAYESRFRTYQGIPGLSYTWVALSPTVGALLLLVTTLEKIFRLLRGVE